MDEKTKLEVSDWQYEPIPLRIITNVPSLRRRIPAPVFGLIGTILLHSLVIQTVLVPSSGEVLEPTTLALASAASAASAESDMTLIIMQPTKGTNSNDSPVEEFISRGSVLNDMPIALVNLVDPPSTLSLQQEQMSDNPKGESTVDSGDPAGRARLFEIYSGQIQARIERAWHRPRTPVNENRRAQGPLDDDTFRCQVSIIQDDQGYVQEILLPQCDGSAAWQRSLVIAIQQSSPLPAPPSSSVFSRTIAMNFIGFSYLPGQRDEDYEIVRSAQAKPIPSADVP